MRNVLYLALLILFSSCASVGLLDRDARKERRQKERCNRKLERITKKCPILLDSVVDTVVVYATADSISVVDTIPQNRDTSKVDSVIAQYKSILDSIRQEDSALVDSIFILLNRDLNRIVINRPCIDEKYTRDTVARITIGNDTFNLPLSFSVESTSSGQIVLSISIPKTNFKAKVPDKDTIVKKAEISLLERLDKMLGRWLWILVVIAILGALFLVYKILK